MNNSKTILIVDDEPPIRTVLSRILIGNHYSTIEADNGNEAVDIFKRESPSAVLLDLQLPGCNGKKIMEEIKAINPDVPVIIVTGSNDIETAVDFIRQGAYDFIVKPPKIERLLFTLAHAIDKAFLTRQVRQLSNVIDNQLESSIGKSPAIHQVISQVQKVAASNFSVIIEGETGSGKNFIARIIHNLSSRSGMPFVSIDMGAISETLVESELFGYEKGAFTGADRQKKGLFSIANGGTVFIDELQNMSPVVQSKLLKIVEEQAFYPVGGTKHVEINVRILSSTNTDIRLAVAEKKMREDLFFRLCDFMITVSPLRERPEDIAFLAEKFFRDAGQELHRQMHEISGAAMRQLLNHSWPGNVRELKNVVRRAALLSSDGVIHPDNIDFLIKNEKSMNSLMPLREFAAIALREAESKAIRQTLKHTGGNKTKTAAILQIDYKTLLNKIKLYNINGKLSDE